MGVAAPPADSLSFGQGGRVRTISIINQKGGCGKTTSAINLAGVLARRGFRTLLVDLDPQAHCAAGLAIPEQRIDQDIGDVMLLDPAREPDPSRLLWRVARNLDLAPSRMKLAGLEAARGGLADKPDKERRLAGVLARLAPQYDVCLVDCSPAIGLLTYNALAAADEVLIPVETSFFALQGASKQVSTIRSMAKRLGSGGSYWIIPTIHDESSALARDLLDELRRRFGPRVAPTVIRRDGALKEAASFGQPVVEYAPHAAGSTDYTALADWMVETMALQAPGGTPTAARPAPRAVPIPEPPVVLVPGASAPEEPAPDEPAPDEPGQAAPTVQLITPATLTIAPPTEPLPEPKPEQARPPAPRFEFPVPPPPGAPSFAPFVSDGFAPDSPAEPMPPAAPQVTVVPGGCAEPAMAAVSAPAPSPALTRAEDMARRARVMQLRRADERLRRIAHLERDTPGAFAVVPPVSTPVVGPVVTPIVVPVASPVVVPVPDALPPRPLEPVAIALVPALVTPLAPPAPAEHAAAPATPPRLGVRTHPRRATFIQPLSIGRSAAIAGDFNAWSPGAHVLRPDEHAGVFELTVPLPPGRYSYRLVIDGRWIADPFNEQCEPNPFGEPNSVFTVPETPGA